MDQRYSLQEQLGKGGMGVVYRAFDHLEGRYVALKRIDVDPLTLEMNPLVASPRYQHMLLAHEFRTVAALRHPNIISVLDYGFSAKRQPFFVMELLEAPQTILQAGIALDCRGKIDLLIQLLQAMIYLHHHGILHRDLKPNNVLVNQAGQIQVLDFGLAVKAGDPQDQAGTVHYMAPEVLAQERAVEASDLFAVGVMAYELFAGTRPFMGKTPKQIAERIMYAEPETIPLDEDASNDPILQEILPIIFRLLEKRPENRYPDALSVVRALCQAIGESLPPDEGPIRESFLQAGTFVGRERELEELSWGLTQAKDGHGSAWLVGGESGIGKSRLLDELRIHALTEGVTVVRAQIAEGSDSLAQGWGDALRHLLLTVQVNDMEANILQATIPNVDHLLGLGLRDESPVNEEQALAPIIAQLFSRVSHPMLLVMEDLHWATASLEPLTLLMPHLENLPLLIVGSYRSEEAPRLLNQLSGINVIRLEKLSYENMAALSSSMLGSAGRDPHLLDLVYKETEGNAFFMVEVIRAWAEEVGHLGEVGRYALPDSVLTGGMHQIIQRRLKRVPDWAYGGLQVAAVMGRNLNLDALDKILSPILSLMTGEGISVSVSTIWRENRGLTLNDWLLVCADAALLEVHEGDWRFAHDKLREQVLADLDAEQVHVLRSQVEKAFNALYAGTN